ncbi:MAG: PIG-T family GPI transamidase component, partial [Chloroflexota bacterium]|nr:PIG-T family GPI transamidase component [Chloroflexota bacterium]
DPRTDDALALIRERQRDDGRWAPDRSWWRAPGTGGTGVEVVDWGRSGPSEMLTLNALRVLNGRSRAGGPAVASASR